MRDVTARLLQRAEASGLAVPGALLAPLTAYFELLGRWNEKINLTALTDPDEAIDRLLLEPLAAAARIPAHVRLIDLGSGGGSPAIPLALALGAPRLVMVESRERKTAFLREAVRHLELDNVATVETCRFEELAGREGFRETFDVVSIRAVRIDAPTLQAAHGFLRPHGRVALFRGASGPDHLEPVPAGLDFMDTARLLEHSIARLTLLRRA